MEDSGLLSLSSGKLLKKFGSGNHKPGSGSAAAFNGLLACELVLTVIELTLAPERSNRYARYNAEFSAIRQEILETILPRLEYLFEEDSRQFDKAIKARMSRDSALNRKLKNELDVMALQELKLSTEIPQEICSLCKSIARFSIVCFDKGFQSARGDSGVALSNALSAMAGCISIVSLNLQSFPKNEWTDAILVNQAKLKADYELFSATSREQMSVLHTEAVKKNNLLLEFIEIRNMLFGKMGISNIEIEGLSRRVQNVLWKYRDVIWKIDTPKNLLGVLDPEKVISMLKYKLNRVNFIPVNGHYSEIAGIINNEDYSVTIAQQYSAEIVRFTTAHELGHALLHDKIELHRDYPLDGSKSEISRPFVEVQADKFAAYFLMPERLVKTAFSKIFFAKSFQLNEQTATLLNLGSLKELRSKYRTKRDLSRLVASCNHYNYRSIKSLAEIFKVSSEAMAIRLEELSLIDLENNGY